MDNLELMECTLSYIDTLHAISIETFSNTFKEQNSEENLTNYLEKAYNKNKLANELSNPNSSFFFLKKSDQIVGYLKINIEDAQSEYVADNALEIERIYIRKQYLRQGYGKYLFHIAESLAKQYKKETIWLGVWEYNQNAIMFYKQMGFKQIGTHYFLMGDEKQTDLILLKELQNIKI